MSEIALYNLLKQIPNVSDDAVKEAVADIASSRDVATKKDITEVKSELKSDLLKLEMRLVKQMYMAAVVIIVVNIAAVGLTIRFLN
ncbi:MAG: hypothetical protein GDA45_03125 [Chromatiales bacterium]|nr:hypothetical protein [Chromatiales bacterium]